MTEREARYILFKYTDVIRDKSAESRNELTVHEEFIREEKQRNFIVNSTDSQEKYLVFI